MTRVYKLFILTLFSTISSFAQQWPKCIMRGDYADPSIMREGRDFYMTHSAFNYNPGFLIWHSRDLVNWKPVTRVITQRVVIDAWAPDLLKHNGKYYLYYPWNDRTWVCIADKIEGPWSPPIEVKGSQGIDPGHVVTQDGMRYLWVNNGNMAPLDDKGTACLAPFRSVYHGWDIPKDWVTEGKWPEKYLESPKLTWHDGYYYLTCAEGGTAGPATSHMCVMARSRSMEGPWENSPYNPVIHTWSEAETWWSQGHGTLIDDADGQWWMVYHSYAKDLHSLGRMTLLMPMEWTSDGWCRASYDAKLPGDAAPNSAHGNNAFFTGKGSWLSDDFTSKKLGLQWSFYQENAIDAITLGGGRLVMYGKGDGPSDARYLLVTAEDPAYEVSCELTVGDTPAGLMLYYNKDHFCGVTVDRDRIYFYEHNHPTQVLDNKFGARVVLRLRNVRNKFTADIASNQASLRRGKGVQNLCSDIDISDMNHNRLGAFLALRPGLMVQGGGKAEFRHFSYNVLDVNWAPRAR